MTPDTIRALAELGRTFVWAAGELVVSVLKEISGTEKCPIRSIPAEILSKHSLALTNLVERRLYGKVINMSDRGYGPPPPEKRVPTYVLNVYADGEKQHFIYNVQGQLLETRTESVSKMESPHALKPEIPISEPPRSLKDYEDF